jgi:hypothetical protein
MSVHDWCSQDQRKIFVVEERRGTERDETATTNEKSSASSSPSVLSHSCSPLADSRTSQGTALAKKRREATRSSNGESSSFHDTAPPPTRKQEAGGLKLGS